MRRSATFPSPARTKESSTIDLLKLSLQKRPFARIRRLVAMFCPLAGKEMLAGLIRTHLHLRQSPPLDQSQIFRVRPHPPAVGNRTTSQSAQVAVFCVLYLFPQSIVDIIYYILTHYCFRHGNDYQPGHRLRHDGHMYGDPSGIGRSVCHLIKRHGLDVFFFIAHSFNFVVRSPSDGKNRSIRFSIGRSRTIRRS